MYDAVLKHSGKVKIMTEDVYAMAISTDHWPNKHNFQEHWKNRLPSKRIIGDDMVEFVNYNFPEANSIFK